MDLDGKLYRAVKVEAARGDRSVRDVIAEAIERWLEDQGDEEDLPPGGAHAQSGRTARVVDLA